MHLLDVTFASPAENLACDEALLDELDDGRGAPALRFWESATHFVVVGYGNKFTTEVNVAECLARNVPVYRRISGGGTVVQGPGCLSYALVLPIANETATITDANCYVMKRVRDAFRKLLLGREVEIQGCTDLTVGALKFSGNAQRRKRNALLFHGSFLLNFDLDLIGAVLAHPSKEPDYRAGRSHREFLTNLHLPANEVKAALIKAWNAESTGKSPDESQVEALVREKYGNPSWNEKF